MKTARQRNNETIFNSPVGSIVKLEVHGEVKTFRLEADPKTDPYWCGEKCPFCDVAIVGCPDDGRINGCSLASTKHPSGLDLVLVEVAE